MLPLTGPKPIPYSTIVSPGFAGRDVTPGNAPTGPTKVVPSRKVAVTYCLPAIFHCGSASRPGCSRLTFTFAVLDPAAVLTVTGSEPVPALPGTSAFTWVGLMYAT